MEEQIEARVSPSAVWEAWERAHAKHSPGGIAEGQTGKGKFRYQIFNVKKGESFSILWKSLFVRLIFSHSVKPIQRGSSITYHVQIKGLFAWPVQWLLGEKIRKNVNDVLKAIVKELENQRVE